MIADFSRETRGRPVDVHTALYGRVRTLEHVGRIIHTMGLASEPLPAEKVLAIEEKALRKLKKALRSEP